MPRATRFCRFAWQVDDMERTVARLRDLLGLSMRFGDIGRELFIAGIDEHGLEPIQLLVPDLPFMAQVPAPFIELALAVDDAEATRQALADAGITHFVASYLPAPDRNEYLYGTSAFHGLPLMVCTDGDNELQMAPFRDLEAAPPPKLGCITLQVPSIDAAVADFGRFFDMRFTETDPAGLGARAVVGPHRVKLIEAPTRSLQAEFMPPLLAGEMMFDDVESIRHRLEQAGHSVLAERRFRSGGRGYFFGIAPVGFPLSIYATTDDAEARGLT